MLSPARNRHPFVHFGNVQRLLSPSPLPIKYTLWLPREREKEGECGRVKVVFTTNPETYYPRFSLWVFNFNNNRHAAAWSGDIFTKP